MNRIGLKAALLVIVASIALFLAWDGDAGVRNCTWCSGTSGQGYMVAPRLAGQRPASIESQIIKKLPRSHAQHSFFEALHVRGMRADIHDGPEHNALQAEAGYIDARPYLPDRQKPLATRGRPIHSGHNQRSCPIQVI